MPTHNKADAVITLVSPANHRYGPWKTFEGGDLSYEKRMVRPPGGSERAETNPNGTRSDITVGFDEEVGYDWDAIETEGGDSGWKVLVTKKAGGVATGKADTYLCTLTEVNTPDYDSDAGNETAAGTLVFACNEKKATS